MTEKISLALSIAALAISIWNRWIKPPIKRVENGSGYAHFDKDDKLINSQKQ